MNFDTAGRRLTSAGIPPGLQKAAKRIAKGR